MRIIGSIMNDFAILGSSLLTRFRASCREWMGARIARPDEPDWFALWMPSHLAQMA